MFHHERKNHQQAWESARHQIHGQHDHGQPFDHAPNPPICQMTLKGFQHNSHGIHDRKVALVSPLCPLLAAFHSLLRFGTAEMAGLTALTSVLLATVLAFFELLVLTLVLSTPTPVV